MFERSIASGDGSQRSSLLPASPESGASTAARLGFAPVRLASVTRSLLSPLGPAADVGVQAADQLERDAPANLDVWIVLEGGGESLHEGMRSFVRSRRKDFDARQTFVLAIDSVGRGDVRFQPSAGWVVSYRMDRRMVELSEAIATADAGNDDQYGAAGFATGLGGAATVAAAAGWRPLGITCLDADGYVANRHLPADTPKAVNHAALDRAHGFALELIRRLDADVGRGTKR